MAAEIQQWAEGIGTFVKPGDQDIEIQVKGRTLQKSIKVGNTGKTKVWFCGFCGDSAPGNTRGIKQHLVKLPSKKGGGCPEVVVDTLRELICFSDDIADLADKKIAAIQGEIDSGSSVSLSESEDSKGKPESPERKKRNPRVPDSPEKPSPKRPKSNPKASPAKKEKAEKAKMDPADGKGKKDRSAKTEQKTEKSDMPGMRKRKKGPARPPPKRAKGVQDADAEAVYGVDADADSDKEVEEDLLGIDGLDDSEMSTAQEVSLVAAASLVAETPLANWEDESEELTEQVPLQDGQAEFLDRKLLVCFSIASLLVLRCTDKWRWCSLLWVKRH